MIGETLVVNGHPMTIIGVAPRGFQGTTLGMRPDVFVPITMRGLMSPGFDGFENRRAYWAYLFGRLRPGVTVERAEAAINAVYRPVIEEVEAPLNRGMSDRTLAEFRAERVVLEDGCRGQSALHAEAGTPLILLISITAIVLLIACANIANLLLARGANRSAEMAVRLSLGAGRRRLIGQLLTESLLLAVFGGIAGIVVGWWTLAGIAALLPPEAAELIRVEMRPSVVGFAAALAVGTGLLFGIFPALHSTRRELITAIRAEAGQPSGARAAARFRGALVTAQIALSMALLVSAGLFIRSLVNISRVDLGLETDRVITFGISPALNGYDLTRSRALFQRVEEELAALPGVTAVAASRVPLLAGSNWSSNVSVEGFEQGPDTDADANWNQIGNDFFRTVGIPLLAGREFTEADAGSAPRVAIVNEAFARNFGLGRDVVGRRMAIGRTDQLDIEIVGLVEDAKYSQVKGEAPPQFFRPYRQAEGLGSIRFYARTAASPDDVLRAVRPLIARLAPNLPVEDLKTLPQQVRDNVFVDRMIGTLSTALAVLATLLAAIGLYGVLAYTVVQRTREIGVRMTLGADGPRVRRLVLGQVGRMTAVGAAVGAVAAIALGRAARSLLFGIGAYDPLAVGGAVVALVLVALGAGYLPARRASSVDPMRALRYE